MAGRQLAFRVYGRFLFPGATQENVLIAGMFEFFYVEEGDKWVACVEWRPGSALSGSGKLPNCDLADCPNSLKSGEAFCLRLEKPIANAIQINGAMAFDQYRKDGSLDLRLLLAREFKLGATPTPCHSAVVLGAKAEDASSGEPCFGFVLALPTPGPQGVIDGKPHYVFPFRVQFLTKRDHLEKPDDVVPADWIAAGVKGTVSACKWTTSENSQVKLRLGKFGFCYRDPQTPHDKYVEFPRRSEVDTEKKRNALWLVENEISEALYCTDVLGRFANTKNNLNGRVMLKVEREDQLSIWLAANDDASKSTRIVFRSSFMRRENASLKSGDIVEHPSGNAGMFGFANPFGGSELEPFGSDGNCLDIALSYEITDNHLVVMLNDGEAEIGGEIEVAIMVDAPIDNLAENCNEAIAALRGQLALVDAGDPTNLLPDIRIEKKNQAPIALIARIAFRFETIPNRIQWLNQPSRNSNWSKANFGLEPWRIDPDRGLETDKKYERATASFTLPDFAPGPGRFTATLVPDAGPVDPDAPGAIRFKLDLTDIPALKASLGALDLTSKATIPAGHGVGYPFGHWRFRPGEKATITSLEFGLSNLPIAHLEPKRTDRRRGDRSGRDRPLLLRSKDAAGSEAPFALDISESLTGKDDRRMIAKIIDLDAAKATVASYVVLSQQPFSVLQVRPASLASRGDSGNSKVAFWDSDTRQWQFKLIGSHYHYRLPPQAVGESMDKPRRLHIVDPQLGSNLNRPYPDEFVDEKGVAQRYAVEYRLSPPADLWLDPVDVERGYFLPEWESREIFRQHGELGIGAGLAGFRGEFLYGMPVSIDPAREGGAARGARVAEIEALLGRPPGEVEAGASNGHDRRWNRIARAIAHRPERLEMWMREPGSAQPFVPARFAAGARHALRDSARFRPPLEPPLLPEADDTRQKKMLVDHGLSGGAIWPVEQRAFVRQLLAMPNSSASTIERIALSPHGGDADQRAEFLNGLVSIIAETRSGRVQRQRVEIVGRIGVFWHRAKHVVVYERTVNPSAQFTPDGGIGSRTRRPVVRKVEEYVELLEPERFYPDNPRADIASCGFLHAVRFNSRRIHVDSEWSEEVDGSGGTGEESQKSGWRIPLWNRHSAERRPSVYPRPDVAFVTHAEGEGDQPLTAQECLDPDNLYFYSDATAVTSDTDSWREVLGVDWINLPPPSAAQQPQLDPAERSEGKRLPSAPRIPRGHRRFTWRLAPPAQRTTLNAGRSGQPLYAGLETLTFSRAGHVGESEVAKTLANAIAAVGQALDPAPSPLTEIERSNAAFRKAVDIAEPKLIKETAKQLEQALTKAKQDNFAWADKAKPSSFYKFIEDPGKQCTKVVDEFAAGFERRKLLYLAHLRAWAEDVEADLRKLGAPLPDYDRLIKELTDFAMNALAPALTGVQHDIGRVEQDVARARAMIGDFEAETARVLGDAQRKLAELRQTYDADKPWSPHRSEEHHKRIAAIRDGIAGDIEAAASEVRQRLATELGQIGHAIGVALANEIENAARGEAAILAGLDDGKKAAQAFLADLRTRIDHAFDEVDQELARTAGDSGATEAEKALIGEIEALLDTAVEEANGHLGNLSTGIENGAVTLNACISGAEREVEKLATQIRDFAGQAEAKLGGISHEKLSAHVARVRAGLTTLIALTSTVADSAAMAAGGLRVGLALAEDAAQTILRGLADWLDAFASQVLVKIEEAIETAKSDSDKQTLHDARGQINGLRSTAITAFDEAARQIDAGHNSLSDLVSRGMPLLEKLVADAKDFVAKAKAHVEQVADEALEVLIIAIEDALGKLEEAASNLIAKAAQWGAKPDFFVARLEAQIGSALVKAEKFRENAFREVDDAHLKIATAIKDLKDAVSNDAVKMVIKKAVGPALRTALSVAEYDSIKYDLEKVRARIVTSVDVMADHLDDIAEHAAEEFKKITATASQACKAINSGLDSIKTQVDNQIEEIKKSVNDQLATIIPIIDNVQALIDFAKGAGKDIGKISSEFTNARVAAEAYADRVIDAAGNVTKGGFAAAPNNLLRLYAAAASAPALPNLDFARERLGYYYGQLNSVIDTTPAEAWFGRLGDELKALGLSLPFSKIGDAIVPDDLSKFDIGRVFRNFGGVDLSNLFQGIRLPAGSENAIKVTHDFDRKASRAWVQVDINLPLPGRNPLFVIGPFTLDFVDTLLVATVRLEASKDTDKVEQSGRAALTTTVDAVVSGQSMVALEKLVVNFGRNESLKIDLDPRRIKLNPAFKFIQESLGKLFSGDDEEAGGLKLVKHNGLPVGIEHLFAIPPFDAMAGTSGVSNISISNRFSLLAFPDFVIGNSFALSKPDRPFIFSIFVLGGTGYLTVDCEYRPFNRALSVVVEAAAGGSAALGLSLGPVCGSVQITLSVALSYRKQIGSPGGGLTASMVLVIAGRVDVASIASVHITLMLRMAYHENGRIDGVGTLTVAVRVSRFYTYRVRRDAKYKLRDGGGGGGARSLGARATLTPRERAKEILGARG